jgi:hypothetical protein
MAPWIVKPLEEVPQSGHGQAAVELVGKVPRPAPRLMSTMGPRSWGRGDEITQKTADGTLCVPQWGHGRRGRGDLQWRDTSEQADAPQWGHGFPAVGDGSGGSWSRSRRSCRNGATAFRPWRPAGALPAKPATTSSCNGAMAIGRGGDCGSSLGQVVHEGAAMGRGRRAVETDTVAEWAACGQGAAMGPLLSDRGDLNGDATNAGTGNIPQWRHDPSYGQIVLVIKYMCFVRAAMGLRPSSRGGWHTWATEPPGMPCRNGAMAGGPWRRSIRNGSATRNSTRRNGPRRRPEDAATAGSSSTSRTPCTGLQRIRRGDHLFYELTQRRQAQLQWGHGVSTVETGGIAEDVNQLFALQWGPTAKHHGDDRRLFRSPHQDAALIEPHHRRCGGASRPARA